MKKVLLTGSSGFIGTKLQEILMQRGYKIFGVSSQPSRSEYVCDLRQKESVEKLLVSTSPDIVVHAAALSSVTRGSVIEYYESNVLATDNIISSLRLLGGRKRIIFLSSAAVYGNQPGIEFLTENLCPKPISHYGLSKYVCERILINSMVEHDITIVRPFNLVGNGQNSEFIIPKIIEHFVRGEKEIRLGNLKPTRDFIDLDIASRMICDLIDMPKSIGEIFNLCSGHGYSVQDLIDYMVEITGREIKVIADPAFVRKSEVWRLHGSVEKLIKIFPEHASYRMPMKRCLHELFENIKHSFKGA